MTACFSSRVTNFEFVKSVKESGFSFKAYKEKIDLSRIAHLDLDRVARDLDISVLQEHVGTIVNCDLGDLKGIDPGLVKLLHLSQLCLDYCLYSQDFLSTSLNSLETVHVETLKELEALKKENKGLKEKLKKDSKKKKLLSEQKENVLVSYYECTQCKKGYSSQEYLESHIQRRHSSDFGIVEPSREMLQELKKDIEALREELLSKKQAADTNILDNKQEILLRREEALWAEIEKSQAEQRARHQAEIADLTANFQIQLKQSLADLAENLSKSEINAIGKKPPTESSNYTLQAGNMESVVTEISDMWQTKFDQQASWFRSENSRLMEQLQKMQDKEEDRWSHFQKMQIEQEATKSGQVSSVLPKPPVPATRHKKIIRQSLPTTTSVSKLEFKTFAPTAPSLDDVEDIFESTEESSYMEKEHTVPQNFVVCVPKIVPSRPKSATSSKIAQPPESQSEEEESSQQSEDIDAKLKEMKEAIHENPALIESLKNEVETQVQEKLAEVGIGFEEGLNQVEFNTINKQLKVQRKATEKHYDGFWKLRKGIEKKVDKKIKEGKGDSGDSNIKPSKLKQHPGFFAKLTKSYSKKGNKSKSETHIFTSTPMKQNDEKEHQSILKSSKENVKVSRHEQNSEEPIRSLTRAQSLPANKFVSFVSNNEDKENSWDESVSKKAEINPEKKGISVIGTKNPFVVSTAPKQSLIQDENFDIDELEKELAEFQVTKNSAAKEYASISAVKPNKTNLSLNASDDNSWDLEDI